MFPFATIDLEAINSHPAAICQIGIVTRDEFHETTGDFIVKPDETCGPADPYAMRVHGIDPELIERAPSWWNTWNRAETALEGFVVFAHGASFERRALVAACDLAGLAKPDILIIDSLTLAKKLVPKAPSYKLHMLGAYLGLDMDDYAAHYALDDAMLCADIVETLCTTFEIGDLDELKAKTGLKPEPLI